MEKRVGSVGRHAVSVGTPARFQRDALFTGNGRHRLHVFGDPCEETMVLEQEDLYMPLWKETPRPAATAQVLGEVRRLLLDGRYEEASFLSIYGSLANGVSDRHLYPAAHPAFVLKIRRNCAGTVYDYLHSVNLRNAVVTTRWSDERGAWRRESLVPRTAENMAYTRISAPDGCEQEIRLVIERSFPALEGEWIQSADQAVGHADWSTVDKTASFRRRPQPPELTVKHAERAFLVTGTYAKELERGGYAAVLLVNTKEGSVFWENDECIVRSRGDILLLMKALPCPVQTPDDLPNLLDALQEASRKAGMDFDALAEKNALTHGNMFDRLELSLGARPMDYFLTTGELLEQQRLGQGIHPVLMEKITDMGRFFLLCYAGHLPPLFGHVNININHQVSCGNIGALPEMLDVFLQWIERQIPDARENAKQIFGARGFLIAGHPDHESGLLYHFNHNWPHHYWISGSGWCLQPFLEHYFCTGDIQFLKERLLPLYVELSLFYEDYLTLLDENGKWIFAPSYSPENFPANTRTQVAINATMDITVCREVMDVLLELGPLAGVGTPAQREVWENIRNRLPDYLIGDQGELKEWAWASLEERYDHRHLSHLYGAYPGDEIQPDRDMGLYKAAFISNRMRAQENASAHGVAHRAQIAARLKDPELVQLCLKQLLETGYLNEGLSTRHNPYLPHSFPDAQGAIPTIVLESILYSRPGLIELLPAVPDCWPVGSLSGMMTRSAVRLERLQWNLPEGKMKIALMPLKDQCLELKYRPGFQTLAVDGVIVAEDGKGSNLFLHLEKGKAVEVNLSGAGRFDISKVMTLQ